MKFGEIKTNYYDTTGKASDVSRQLAFVGFGVVWIFRIGTTGVTIPNVVVPAAVAFALALILDALHYGVAAHRWRKQVELADKVCKSDDDDCDVPDEINEAPKRFFAWKLYCVGFGYAWLVGAILCLAATGRLQ